MDSQPATEFRTYASRWWAVTGLVLVAVTQCVQWNTYAPMSQVVENTYGWDDNFIALLANAANIPFTVTCPFWATAAASLGLRCSMLISMFLLVLCAGIRCLTIFSQKLASPIAVIAMASNGLSAPPLNFLAPVVSETWFGPSQRSSATALSNNAVYLGVAFGFIFGPLAVPTDAGMTPSATDTRLSLLYLGHFVWAVLAFIALLVYYPAKPPTPPSASATYRDDNRVDHRFSCRAVFDELRAVLSVRQYLVLFITCIMTIGIYQVQQAYLGVVMKNEGVDESQAGWIGFFSTLAGCAGCILVGTCADRLGVSRLKYAMASCQLAAAVFLCAFAFEVTRPVEVRISALLYVLSMLGSFFINATVPLYFELGVECTFPLPESSSAGAYVFFQGVVQTIMFALPFDSWGTTWLLWALPAALVPACVCLILARFEYRRTIMEGSAPSTKHASPSGNNAVLLNGAA